MGIHNVASRNKCYYSGTQIFGGATNQDMLLNKTCFYSQIRNGADWISRVGLLVVVKMKYSSVHISSDSLFSKILKKPSIVQKKMMPHMNGQHVSFEMKQKTKDNSEDWTPQ